MGLQLTDIRWLRTIVSSLVIIIASFLVITIITAGYAFVLAFKAHGTPDQSAISQFAASLSRWVMPFLEILFTFVVAFMSAKKVPNRLAVHGILIGTLAGILGTLVKVGFGGQLNLRTYIAFVIIVGSGFVGGYVCHMRLPKKVQTPA